MRLPPALACAALGVAALSLAVVMASLHFAPGWGVFRISGSTGWLFVAVHAFVGVGVAVARAFDRGRIVPALIGIVVAAPLVVCTVAIGAATGLMLWLAELHRDTVELHRVGLIRIYADQEQLLCFHDCDRRLAVTVGPLPVLRYTDFTIYSQPRFTERGDVVRVQDDAQCIEIDRNTGSSWRC